MFTLSLTSFRLFRNIKNITPISPLHIFKVILPRISQRCVKVRLFFGPNLGLMPRQATLPAPHSHTPFQYRKSFMATPPYEVEQIKNRTLFCCTSLAAGDAADADNPSIVDPSDRPLGPVLEPTSSAHRPNLGSVTIFGESRLLITRSNLRSIRSS